MGVRADVQLRVLQLEPLRALGDDLAAEQPQHDVQPLGEAATLLGARDAEHHRVGREQTRTEAEHRAALGLVVELDHAVGHRERVVVRQRDDARAEPDPARALDRRRDEHLRRGDELDAAGVVLTDPGLGEADALEVLDGLELPADRTRRIDVQRQQPRRHEGAEPQSLAVDGGRSGHGRTLMRDVT